MYVTKTIQAMLEKKYIKKDKRSHQLNYFIMKVIIWLISPSPYVFFILFSIGDYISKAQLEK